MSDNEEVVETEITADDTPIVSNKLKAVGSLDEQEMLAVEAAIMTNNFQGLSVSQRIAIVVKRCEKLGVDPTQGPFVWGKGDGGRLMLVATKNLSQQLRANKDLRCEIVEDWSQAATMGILIVRCTVSIPNGRSDQDIGVVSLKNKQGEGLANIIMAAYTKAKNRATLSLCGVGGLDESEMAAIRSEQRQKLFEAEPQGMRRVEPGPNAMNQGLLGQGTGDHVPGGQPLQVAAPRVSKSGMPYARDLVKAGKGEALEEEEQSTEGEAIAPAPKQAPAPVVQAPPPGRVITARPPGGLVKAGQPQQATSGFVQQVQTGTPNPPAPRPPKASPVRAGGK